MKDAFNRYGRKLTEKEYTEAAAAAYSDNRKTTDAMIDYRLGAEYPENLRKAMHRARERSYKKFILAPATLVKAFVGTMAMNLGIIKGVPDFDEKSLDFATRTLAREFAKETTLPAEDIVDFFGGENAEDGKIIGAYVRKLRQPKP